MWHRSTGPLTGEGIAPVVDIYTRQVLTANAIASLVINSLNVRHIAIPSHLLPEGVASLDLARHNKAHQALQSSPFAPPRHPGPPTIPPFFL